MQLDRARDVPLLVERRVLVDLGRHHVLVAQVLREPLGRDENGLLVSPRCQPFGPSIPFLFEVRAYASYSSPGVRMIFHTM